MIFNGFVRLFTGLPFQDTQCGFKAFIRDRSQLVFEQQRIEGFGFILKYCFSPNGTGCAPSKFRCVGPMIPPPRFTCSATVC